MSLTSLTAVELGKKIKTGEVGVMEAAEAALSSIRQKEPQIHAFVTIDEKGLKKRAKEVQKQIDEGSLKGALAGVPVAVKDNLCTRDLLTNCS